MRKRWEYRGFTMRWNKDLEMYKLYNRDGEEEWEESSEAICKEWIDSYYKDMGE